MGPDRRAEINRRLAEFDGWKPGEQCPGKFLTGCSGMSRGWDGFWSHKPHEMDHDDYCRDLNALARLEGKLPTHEWAISYIKGAPKSYLFIEDFPAASAFGPEAETRAEAIFLYLTSQDKENR